MIDFIVSKRQMIIQSFVSLNEKRILEVACGGGYLTRSLVTNDNRVLGIDPQQSLISTACNVCPKALFMNTSFEDFDIAHWYFDLIVFSKGLHEMQNQRGLIIKAQNIVGQGKILIIERNVDTQFFNVVKNIIPSLIEEEIDRVQKTAQMIKSMSPIKTQIFPNIMHFNNVTDFWKICLDGDKNVKLISILDVLGVKLNESFNIEDNMIMYLL